MFVFRSFKFFGSKEKGSDCPFLFTTEFPHTYVRVRQNVRKAAWAKLQRRLKRDSIGMMVAAVLFNGNKAYLSIYLSI